MPETAISLIHLSDIHFNRGSGTTYDLDTDLRSQLEIDVGRLKDEVGEYTGIIITGDIAFSATDEEYEKAFAWVEQLCDLSGVEINYVWMVPGNHDVSWPSTSSPFHKLLRDELRRTPDTEIDRWLMDKAKDAEVAKVINAPLGPFNKFAGRFGCATELGKSFWEFPLELNDGSSLILVGLNSVLMSTREDSNQDQNSKLILPKSDCLRIENPKVAYLSLCHHPHRWLRSDRAIEDALDSRIKVQLFGHEHDQQVKRVGESLRVHAGAVHPERDQSMTDAHYNILSLSVTNDAQQGRRLRVRVYPRQYNSKEHRFEQGRGCAVGNYQEHLLRLPPLPLAALAKTGSKPSTAESAKEAAMPEVDFQLSMKLLMINLSKLEFPKQIKIAAELGVYEKGDESLVQEKRFAAWLARAREKHLLRALWERVEAAAGRNDSNPFRK